MTIVRKAEETKGFPCQDCATAIKVVVELPLLLRLTALDEAVNGTSYKKEWIVVLWGDKEQGLMHVKDFYLPPQEVSGATCEFDPETVPSPPEGMSVLGTLHRHPGNMVSYSGQDSGNIFADHPLSLIMHDGADIFQRVTAYIKVNLPCCEGKYRIIKVEGKNLIFNVDHQEDFKTLVAERVKTKTYVHAGGVYNNLSRFPNQTGGNSGVVMGGQTAPRRFLQKQSDLAEEDPDLIEYYSRKAVEQEAKYAAESEELGEVVWPIDAAAAMEYSAT